MESPYYEMTHDIEEEYRSFQNGYIQGYNDAMMKFPSMIIRCKDCKRRGTYDCPVYVGGDGMRSEPDNWFCADAERKDS